MRGFFERAHLTSYLMRCYHMAVCLVEKIDEYDDLSYIRCHELARAVKTTMFGDDEAQIVDGLMNSVDHTWILLFTHGVILDVYTPGRLPMVQMIHHHTFIARQYAVGAARTDIREDVVKMLMDKMRY